ncbi:3-hydroxy-3-methylglutaryl-coenzyme A reductase [Portunus trituberculatus]|uniref:3-hydroxy-3-methylglutaryl-coenzyme A reductase n=1 Tax=Portunus trituberculatus TaxID=210409 RepID=A0A5B7EXI4_PORTR|nr:3-hydroxy-3-methylglutaryl-coenzyme A reductase [Portunus trituberculatus]
MCSLDQTEHGVYQHRLEPLDLFTTTCCHLSGVSGSMQVPVGTLEECVLSAVHLPPISDSGNFIYSTHIRAHITTQAGAKSLSDSEVVLLVEKKQLPGYQLEKVLEDPLRAVGVRRRVVAPHTANLTALDALPYCHYDYSKVSTHMTHS